MRFWDSSALVPLVIAEPRSDVARGLLRADPRIAAWWSTPVECASALWRRHRAGDLDGASFEETLADLHALLRGTEFVLPGDSIRERALRILAVHAIGAADALQLSAALVRWGSRAENGGFVCLDERLREAARREGLSVLPHETVRRPASGGDVAEALPRYGGARPQTLRKIRRR
ncbi:MAG TPA: type II toxin-antitoxin system VapC family toxin [Planctomycetota bacterium]|nr:type II toxin-antitoxin system VapC family toxin [Planctomycetota bacterium]